MCEERLIMIRIPLNSNMFNLGIQVKREVQENDVSQLPHRKDAIGNKNMYLYVCFVVIL